MSEFRSDIESLDLDQVIYADRYFLKSKSEEDKHKIIRQWLNDAAYLNFRFPNKSAADILFLRSLNRADYREFFRAVYRSTPDAKVQVVEDFKERAERISLSFSRFLTEHYFLLDYIDVEGSLDRQACFIRLVHYFYILSQIKKTDFKAIVFFADMQPLENLCSQYFRLVGKKTVTLQHGLYIDYGDIDTVNVINYKHQPSEYFLAWGAETADLISKYHPGRKIKVVGKPSTFGLGGRSPSNTKTPDSISVIFDQRIFDEQNEQMLNVALGYASTRGYRVLVRFHPSINKGYYLDKYPEIIEEQDLLVSNIIIGHTSSMLYEVLDSGAKVYRYQSDVPNLWFPAELEFTDLTGFSELVTKNFDYSSIARRYIECSGEESLHRYRNALLDLI